MSSDRENKYVIVLLGPPGSGKGTQGMLLAEKLNLYYFEVSKVLEEAFATQDLEKVIEIEGEKYTLRHEKEENWEKGKLCSPPLVAYLNSKKIKELHAEGKGLVLSGAPRTLYEGEKLMPLLKELYGQENIKVILLEITPQQTIFRNTHRRICELLRHSILYSEETKNLIHCPLDGSRLIRREKLDDLETIKIRIKEYEERTLPLVNFFISQGIEVKKINGEQTVAKVFDNVLKALAKSFK